MAQPKQCLSKATPHSPVFSHWDISVFKYVFASLYLHLFVRNKWFFFGSLQRWQQSHCTASLRPGALGVPRVAAAGWKPPSWISSFVGISYAAPFLNKSREQTAIPVQHLSEALWPRCRRPDAAKEWEPTFVLPPFRQTLFVSNIQPR